MSKNPGNSYNDNTLNSLTNHEFLDLLDYPVTTIYLEKPILRNSLIPMIINSTLYKENVIYFDFDTWFRCYLSTNPINQKLLLFSPNKKNLEDSLISFLSWTRPKFNLLIIDSASSFYHILRTITDFNKANKLFVYYLFALKNLVKTINAQMIILSFPKQRPSVKLTNTSNYISTKILNHLSEKIILADYVDEDIHIKTLDKDSLLKNSFLLKLQ